MSAFESPQPIVFFGTPEFAVPTLAALCERGLRPTAVVTRPAKPVGRGHAVHQPPVARYAEGQGLPVWQPERARDETFLAELAALRPAVAVVVAYGQIFSRRLLDLPTFGCINLHASLLPRHRGAAPIQAAIAEGDATTGVTTMQMAEGLDSGPILLQRELAIGEDETAGELAARLATLGADLMVATLHALAERTLMPRPQDESLVTYAPRLRKEMARLDWSQSARVLSNRLRAYTPWPGGESALGGESVKVLRGRAAVGVPAHSGDKPGTIVAVERDRLRVVCGDGSLLDLFELQRPGRRALAAGTFANGERIGVGARFV